MPLTIQTLSNLSSYSWELQRELGFHMQSPANFREYINQLSDKDMRNMMENLGLLFRTVEEIGQTPIEVKQVVQPQEVVTPVEI